jgi:hypothetical protein
VTLPAFASTDDLDARGVDVSNLVRAQTALDDASAVIRLEANTSWVVEGAVDFGDLADYLQDAIVTVCISVARRVLENPDGAESMTLGDASVSLANSSNDIYLTASERKIIRRASGRGSIGSIRLEGEGVPNLSGAVFDGEWAHDQFGGDLIPWVDTADLP